MIVSFDTNVLVYATAPASLAKSHRARDVIARGMRTGECVLLLQTLAEFANVAIVKAGIPVDDVRAAINAWRAVLPVRAAEEDDLPAALDAVKSHILAFRDAVLWAAARRVGVRYLLTEDLQDGFDLDGVRFVDPFAPANERLIDDILPR
jgi:predicted nucleic acid-binding protein